MLLFKNIYIVHPLHYAGNLVTKRNLGIKDPCGFQLLKIQKLIARTH